MDVGIPEVEPVHPVVDEGLIAFEVTVGHHGHVCLELIQHLRVIVVHVLLEGLHVVCLLVLLLFLALFLLLAFIFSRLLQQRPVLGEVRQERAGRCD